MFDFFGQIILFRSTFYNFAKVEQVRSVRKSEIYTKKVGTSVASVRFTEAKLGQVRQLKSYTQYTIE